MLNTREVAERLRRHPDTIKAWRKAGVGPPFVKTEMGGILYDEAALDAWLQSRTVSP
jgi:DNA-binding transcriptional MerR regulator